MSVPAKELKSMAERLRRLERERESRTAARIAEALAEADCLVADFSRLDPEIEKIVLFGSLARKEATSPAFDIDLAVECSGDRFLALVARALDSPFKVDVVDLRTADARIRAAVARDGVVLYAK